MNFVIKEKFFFGSNIEHRVEIANLIPENKKRFVKAGGKKIKLLFILNMFNHSHSNTYAVFVYFFWNYFAVKEEEKQKVEGMNWVNLNCGEELN